MNRPSTRLALIAGTLALAGISTPLVARAQSNAYNSIGLEWTAGGDDGTVGQASYYQLKYSTSQPAGSDSLSIVSWWGGASSASSLPAPSMSGSTDSTRVTGLTPGTTYYFVIRSVDKGGNTSPFSNIASGSTLTCDAPTGTPGSFQAVADTGRVDLSWSGTDPLATMIHVYRGVGSSGSLSLYDTLSDPTATTFTDTQVTAGTTYRYRVAWASNCADGPSTAVAAATLPGTPPPPPGAPADAPRLHAYPNPSAGSSTVQFVIHVPGSASEGVLIRLYDLTGRWIATLADGSFGPGDHTIPWDRLSRTGRVVSPGYYEAIGTVGGTKVRQRILLTP